jgi:hypothetical protein
MIERVEIIGDPRRLDPHEPLIERLEVRLRSNLICTVLPAPRLFMDPRRETREEYAHRLRYAVRDMGRFVEKEITSHLNRMGHIL